MGKNELIDDWLSFKKNQDKIKTFLSNNEYISKIEIEHTSNVNDQLAIHGN